MNVAVLIPAYRPAQPLIDLVNRLVASPAHVILVVDDGSGSEYQHIFEQCRAMDRVRVLPHAINLGKGAALKTGLNAFLCEYPDLVGVVTADADGQHHPDDVIAVARTLEEHPDTLVLGARQFDSSVPARSRIGNLVTRTVVRFLVGQTLSDTQTGLRGIPRSLAARLLEVGSSGYEFELDMLIAAKHLACPVVEQKIRTIYEQGNKSSHFDPLLDSMKIYFVLLRFSSLSLLTALLDNAVFFLMYRWTASVLHSQVIGRLVAVLFNYGAARRAVFLSRERHRTLFPKYLLLVVCNGVLSYWLIRFFTSSLPIGVIWAKLLAESVLFIANFAIQRDFVFTRRRQEEATATDWDRYYTSVPLTAKLTRKYTTAVLISALKRCAGTGKAIVEIGGANSCFLDSILTEVQPREYHVIDTNQYGLDLLRNRVTGRTDVVLHRQSVLDLSVDMQADVVFSIGLIEHFDSPGTRRAVESHFGLIKPGGWAILSFPTPTWLYRAARSITESLGLWKFPDERPLERAEVLETVSRCGQVVFEKTLWPLVFTQHLMVVRKRGIGAEPRSDLSR